MREAVKYNEMKIFFKCFVASIRFTYFEAGAEAALSSIEFDSDSIVDISSPSGAILILVPSELFEILFFISSVLGCTLSSSLSRWVVLHSSCCSSPSRSPLIALAGEIECDFSEYLT